MPSASSRMLSALFAILLGFSCLGFGLAQPARAHAESLAAQGDATVENLEVSSDGLSCIDHSHGFGIGDFSRAQKGSNRDIEGSYRGYAYLVSGDAGQKIQAIASEDRVVVYVPQETLDSLGLTLDDETFEDALKQALVSLDAIHSQGSIELAAIEEWDFTAQPTFDIGGVRYSFDQTIGDSVYATTKGTDGSDLTSDESSLSFKPSFAVFGSLTDADGVTVTKAPSGIAAFGAFLAELDWSPLWVTLKTTGTAIVIVFALGLAAARWALSLPRRARNIADSIFTIPMVLPPTVCGFVLLYLCGRNTAFGQFFIDIGFPLIFSWPATVIAAVVVSFPLMYRSALGAFESLDADMLNAARTLGWSNGRIFRSLMLPLSWSSIAAGTVLAFARALGEFGATLFLAGNYLGITRTIPIAIYFEWMNGNDSVAWFWTAIVLMVSFLVILFINLWTSHTTKYRKGAQR